ncbi:hypothetical protein EPA93_07000 [Ktedonosporobacter rubrisoli]|uniref:Uncharacterized protein n=1 Tax=Ktedonosporobacter rubrisoli TaxID=2509675 RepID=A0A4P6JKS8_KTERU|nr:hypothetical protein [Ktedonosporobacter rubrisoli]QBD75765.1 hypothetical protein EPA93_07000 [Ktedonosporobacter rubrisoli]
MGQHREYLWVVDVVPAGEDGWDWSQLVRVYAVDEAQARTRAEQRLEQLAPFAWQLERLRCCPHGFLLYRRRYPGSRLVDDETGEIIEEQQQENS